MEETTNAETPVELDLSGVHEHLHDLFAVYAREGMVDVLARYQAVLSQIHPEPDGSVVVTLVRDVKVGRERISRYRIRAPKGRDYVNPDVARAISDGTYDGTIRFAAFLAMPRGAVEELEDIRDIDATFLATVILRGNFQSPKT